MRCAPLLLVAVSSVTTGGMLTVRRSSGGLHFGAEEHESRVIGAHAGSGPNIQKRVTCGDGIGPCPGSQCCSEAGYCGSSEDYCKGPQCQIGYSNGNCDANLRPCGESTIDVSRATVGEVPYDTYIYRCQVNGTVALTFDDGPYIYTEMVLDVLRSYRAAATFFITGNNLGKKPIDDASTQWPALLRRMHSEGHQLASHTWTHQNLDTSSLELQEQQLVYNEMAFRNIFGFFPRYLRPPYGACTSGSGCMDTVQRLGYHIIKWTFDTKDFEHNTADTIQQSKDIFDDNIPWAEDGLGYIPLTHDIQYQTAKNLTQFMLQNLKDKGYQAVTLGECLGDPQDNWYVNAGEADAECAPDSS